MFLFINIKISFEISTEYKFGKIFEAPEDLLLSNNLLKHLLNKRLSVLDQLYLIFNCRFRMLQPLADHIKPVEERRNILLNILKKYIIIIKLLFI